MVEEADNIAYMMAIIIFAVVFVTTVLYAILMFREARRMSKIAPNPEFGMAKAWAIIAVVISLGILLFAITGKE